jgi:hypothetical protein
LAITVAARMVARMSASSPVATSRQNSSDPRGRVRREAKARGIRAVASQLGVARSTLTSWLAGAARPGTDALIVVRAVERMSPENDGSPHRAA